MCRRFGTFWLFHLHRWFKKDTACKDRTGREFRNVGTENSDAGESPKRKNRTDLIFPNGIKIFLLWYKQFTLFLLMSVCVYLMASFRDVKTVFSQYQLYIKIQFVPKKEATTLGAGRSGVRIPVWVGNFSFLQTVQIGREAHPTSFNWYRVSFLGIIQTGCEVNNSPPFDATFKNEWKYTSTPPCIPS